MLLIQGFEHPVLGQSQAERLQHAPITVIEENINVVDHTVLQVNRGARLGRCMIQVRLLTQP